MPLNTMRPKSPLVLTAYPVREPKEKVSNAAYIEPIKYEE
jgi:hypothetical protein